MIFLSIIIPTYNRSKDLVENVNTIVQTFEKIKPEDIVEVIISDNASELEHQRLIRRTLENVDAVRLFFQKENIGFEKNCLFLMQNCKGKYVMLLGDDDYISPEYILHCMTLLKKNNLTCIIPNFYSVDSNRVKLDECRDKITEDKILHKIKDINYVVKAHQMSGLVFRRDGVVESYVSKNITSLYPQNYFIGFNLLRGDGVHVTRYPIENTVIKKKNFDYSFDGLFGEFVASIDPLELPFFKKRSLEIYSIRSNNTRFCNRNTFLHPVKFVNHVVQEYRVGVWYKIFIVVYFFARIPVNLFRKIIKFFSRKY